MFYGLPIEKRFYQNRIAIVLINPVKIYKNEIIILRNKLFWALP